MSKEQPKLFLDEEFEETKITPEKVTCLGMEFPSDEARREYFREELRKKLPELKHIEGFPIGEDDDIINLSDPPYYTACPNPWLNDFMTEWDKDKITLQNEGKRKAVFEVKEPYTADVSEGKFDSLYLYHSYLTKVPHKAIEQYINHYTQIGDVIFDGFCGTGMTAAAARLKGRKAIISDLSPLATFISYCVNSSYPNEDFAKNAASIINKTKQEYEWMFRTKHTNGNYGVINYVLWSDVFICPSCGSEIVFWNDAVDIENGKIKDRFCCKKCGTTLIKKGLNKKEEQYYDTIIKKSIRRQCRIPVRINYSYNGKRFEKVPDAEDIATNKKIESYDIPDWVPLDSIYKGDKTDEAINHCINYFYQFYTKRTLCVLAKIKEMILEPIYNYLITKLSFQSTLMYRYTYMNGCWGAGGGPMSGTMYIPSLIKEINIFKQLGDAVNSRKKIDIPKDMNSTLVGIQSITDCRNVKDNSVDYIFTDPPFGSNLMYSEMNYLSEMWLKVKTNTKDECIINKSQYKTIFNYQELIKKAFEFYYRILKPQKWLSVEFSNTSSAVWNAIQLALSQSGFIVVNVAALDKKKGSYNAVNSTTAVKQDLVITCYKPSNELSIKMDNAIDISSNVMDFIEELLIHLPVHIERDNSTTAVIERSPKILYDRLISYYVQHGYAIPMDAQEFQRGLRDRFIERDGMFFTASQALEYEDKKSHTSGMTPMALFIGSEAEGIEWLKRELEKAQTYSDLQPEWMKNMTPTKKGDSLPELMEILEENFIKDEDGKWRKPDAEKAADLEIMRNRKLMKEFNLYLEQAQKPKAKRMKDTRLEVLRYGFKECYKQKDYQAIVTVGDHIQEPLLQEDEVLLQYYDIASSRV